MRTIFAGLLLLVSSFALAAQLPDQVMHPPKRSSEPAKIWPANVSRVAPRGVDGGNRYYLVTCRDQSRTSIHVVIATSAVCAQRPKEKPLCKINWLPLDAAAYVCPR